MSYTHNKTSSHSLRNRARERDAHADEFKHGARGLGEPPNGQMPVGPGLGLGPVLEKVASYWWVELLLGVFWVVISVVVLKFDEASVTTVGILTGLMFLVFAAQESVLAAIDRRGRWIWAIFSVLLAASGIVALIHPTATFAGFADILGFVFLLIGVMWMVQAFTERPINDLWWLTLISGIMMIVLAFWVSGQFFVARAYTLLIFAGIWAMTTGIIDIVRAFQIRELGRELGRHPRR
ncbi:MAG: HdeD family acid-resistance protein [Solirubrobacteraceae bacterium]